MPTEKKPKKPKKTAPKKPKISRQLAWQREKTKAGLCWRCGNPLGKTPYKSCVDCAKKDRERKRKSEGSRPWKEGGRGRPPIMSKTG